MSRLLLIDDDEIALNLLQNFLQEEGHEINSTADGPQGIALFKQRRPDVILLDLGLPSMNGLEVLHRIKSIDPAATVIIITGLGSEEAEQVARGYGATAFLRKPLDLDDLEAAIRQALGVGR